jgi:hypothetical protein
VQLRVASADGPEVPSKLLGVILGRGHPKKAAAFALGSLHELFHQSMDVRLDVNRACPLRLLGDLGVFLARLL